MIQKQRTDKKNRVRQSIGVFTIFALLGWGIPSASALCSGSCRDTRAAEFDAYMKTVDQALGTDLTDKKNLTQLTDKLRRVDPRQLGEGYIARLTLASSKNQTFSNAVKAELNKGDGADFWTQLKADPQSLTKVAGYASATQAAQQYEASVHTKLKQLASKLEQVAVQFATPSSMAKTSSACLFSNSF